MTQTPTRLAPLCTSRGLVMPPPGRKIFDVQVVRGDGGSNDNDMTEIPLLREIVGRRRELSIVVADRLAETTETQASQRLVVWMEGRAAGPNEEVAFSHSLRCATSN